MNTPSILRFQVSGKVGRVTPCAPPNRLIFIIILISAAQGASVLRSLPSALCSLLSGKCLRPPVSGYRFQVSALRFPLFLFAYFAVSAIPALAAADSPVFSPLPPAPSSASGSPPFALPSSLFPLPSPSSAFATMDTLDDKHKLTLGDKLSFRIVEDQEDPKEPMDPRPLVVGDHGDVEVPYIGRFPAVGKTCKQLAQEIKGELEKRYYYQATVIIGLDQFSKSTGKVYVLGEVRATGMIELPGDENLTVGKAVLRAGGFTNYADKRGVKVTRKSDPAAPGAKPKTLVVNLVEVFEKGQADKDVELQPGDIIYVPSRLINL